MFRLLPCFVLGIALLAGCGGGESDTSAAQKNTAKPTKKSKPKPPVEIAVITVKADEFPSIEAALEALAANFQAPEGQARKDQEVRVQKWLVMQGAAAVPAVAGKAGDAAESLEMRITTCRILGQLGTTAVDPLIEIAHSDAPTLLRRKAIESLGVMQADRKVIDALIELLDDSDSLIQWQAIDGLKKFGPAAKAAAPKLAQLRKDGAEESVRVSAGEVLKIIDPRATFVD